ncbi:MAG: hypothetical protein NC124_20685 [Clostridium sp.]|nr:hypothetical protein [Clostridium sp.]
MTGQPEGCVPRKAWKCLHGLELHAGIMKGKYRKEVIKCQLDSYRLTARTVAGK